MHERPNQIPPNLPVMEEGLHLFSCAVCDHYGVSSAMLSQASKVLRLQTGHRDHKLLHSKCFNTRNKILSNEHGMKFLKKPWEDLESNLLLCNKMELQGTKVCEEIPS